MSQKVRIIKVRHAGASVYLGDDSCRNRPNGRGESICVCNASSPDKT